MDATGVEVTEPTVDGLDPDRSRPPPELLREEAPAPAPVPAPFDPGTLDSAAVAVDSMEPFRL